MTEVNGDVLCKANAKGEIYHQIPMAKRQQMTLDKSNIGNEKLT